MLVNVRLLKIRVQFTDFEYPLQCLLQSQVAYVGENAPIGTKIAYSQCASNYTQRPIYYQLETMSSKSKKTGSFIFCQ